VDRLAFRVEVGFFSWLIPSFLGDGTCVFFLAFYVPAFLPYGRPHFLILNFCLVSDSAGGPSFNASFSLNRFPFLSA